MNADEIKEKAEIIRQELGLAQQAHRKGMDDLIKHCPVKPGDVVEIKGYSHTGKKMRVTSISLEYFCGWSWRFYGAVLKNDGSEGKHRTFFNVPVGGEEA